MQETLNMLSTEHVLSCSIAASDTAKINASLDNHIHMVQLHATQSRRRGHSGFDSSQVQSCHECNIRQTGQDSLQCKAADITCSCSEASVRALWSCSLNSATLPSHASSCRCIISICLCLPCGQQKTTTSCNGKVEVIHKASQVTHAAFARPCQSGTCCTTVEEVAAHYLHVLLCLLALALHGPNLAIDSIKLALQAVTLVLRNALIQRCSGQMVFEIMGLTLQGTFDLSRHMGS